jgi:hypothetical protein
MVTLSLALLCLGAAPAPGAVEPPKQPTEPSTADMARIGVAGGYFAGTQRIGYGTRVPYMGGGGGMVLDVLRFPVKHVGFEIGLYFGGVMETRKDQEVQLALDAAFDVAPLRWSGTWAGSLILGVGGGVASHRPAWLDTPIQGYPLLLARLRLFPTRDISLHAFYRFVPITTDAPIDELFVQTHDLELAVGIRWAQVGLRGHVRKATGGDPSRTYREMGIGPFFGAAFY